MNFPQQWRQLTRQGSTSLEIAERHLPVFVRGQAPMVLQTTWPARVRGDPTAYALEVDGTPATLSRQPELNNLCVGASDSIRLTAAFPVQAPADPALDQLAMLVRYRLGP